MEDTTSEQKKKPIGTKSDPKGDQNSSKNPPTLWLGVLDHPEAKGGGFLPPYTPPPWRLARALPKLLPVWAKRSEYRPVLVIRVVEQQKSSGAELMYTLAPFCVT